MTNYNALRRLGKKQKQTEPEPMSLPINYPAYIKLWFWCMYKIFTKLYTDYVTQEYVFYSCQLSQNMAGWILEWKEKYPNKGQ